MAGSVKGVHHPMFAPLRRSAPYAGAHNEGNVRMYCNVQTPISRATQWGHPVAGARRHPQADQRAKSGLTARCFRLFQLLTGSRTSPGETASSLTDTRRNLMSTALHFVNVGLPIAAFVAIFWWMYSLSAKPRAQRKHRAD
jgi:hypothetical protein